MNPSTTVTLAYRFFGTTDPAFSDSVDTIDAEYHSHNVTAGQIF